MMSLIGSYPRCDWLLQVSLMHIRQCRQPRPCGGIRTYLPTAKSSLKCEMLNIQQSRVCTSKSIHSDGSRVLPLQVQVALTASQIFKVQITIEQDKAQSNKNLKLCSMLIHSCSFWIWCLLVACHHVRGFETWYKYWILGYHTSYHLIFIFLLFSSRSRNIIISYSFTNFNYGLTTHELY